MWRDVEKMRGKEKHERIKHTIMEYFNNLGFSCRDEARTLNFVADIEVFIPPLNFIFIEIGSISNGVNNIFERLKDFYNSRGKYFIYIPYNNNEIITFIEKVGKGFMGKGTISNLECYFIDLDILFKKEELIINHD